LRKTAVFRSRYTGLAFGDTMALLENDFEWNLVGGCLV
jgi:hypothetical protein